jgi:hypothetical protein
MSNNNINYGDQVLVFDYRQEARGKGFNQAFCDILPYGLYSGGKLTRLSSTLINISVLVCIIKSDENDKVALRIETQKDQDISLAASVGAPYVDVTKPYIVFRFGWQDVETNYMDMRAVGWSTDPMEVDPDKLHPFDIILGKVIFQETSEESGQFIIDPDKPFDLSRRQDVFIKDSEAIYGQFRVSPSETDSKKVFISGGRLNTSKGRFLLAGTEFPPDGIPNTTEMGRTDLVVIDADGEFKLIQGNPSASSPAPAPKYQTFKVLAEISRGPNRINVLGSDILQVVDATIRGPVTAKDFPLDDSEDFLPGNAKSIEAAFNYIFHHTIAISPEDLSTLGVVLSRNIKWGITDPDEVNAASIPVKDSAELFLTGTVESVLAEIAGVGRTTETLTGLAAAISSLAKVVVEDEGIMEEHIDSTVDNNNVVHGIKIIDDLLFPLD